MVAAAALGGCWGGVLLLLLSGGCCCCSLPLLLPLPLLGAAAAPLTGPAPVAGMDVTRKVVTLARECGAKVELEHVNTGALGG